MDDQAAVVVDVVGKAGHVTTPSEAGPTALSAAAGAIETNRVVAVLAYVAATATALWGVAHVVPTRRVVAGFGPIGLENRRVLLQEWLAEAVTMWGVAGLIVAVTVVASQAGVTAWVYRMAAGLLVALAVLTSLTGARTPVIWFKVCPALLASSATLLIVASFL